MVLRSSLAVDNRRGDQTVQPNNGFNLPGEAYDRFVGRYSMPLAVHFAAFAEVGPSSQVLDVGCGPGALTGELVRLVGAETCWPATRPNPSWLPARPATRGWTWARYRRAGAVRRRLGRRGATAARSTNSERIN